MNKKAKCIYCKKSIEFGCLRCTDCDVAWRAGRSEGIIVMKHKLRETFQTLTNLSTPDEHTYDL